ncbi:MAG: hypoxanthine phosphoribosyltransferase [Bacilli bacterium]|jgi:hypoxanthine phosphoribosyltransferase
MNDKHIGKIIINEEQIIKRCRELGEEITNDYKDKEPVIVGLLTGSVPFVAELIKHINVPMTIDFMNVKSYSGNIQQDKLAFIHDVTVDLVNQDVIIVDDIADSGLTLTAIIEHIKRKGAKTIKVCCLLNKKGPKAHPVNVDYIGFNIESGFLIGFGLDFHGLYRNLPFIAEFNFDED